MSVGLCLQASQGLTVLAGGNRLPPTRPSVTLAGAADSGEGAAQARGRGTVSRSVVGGVEVFVATCVAHGFIGSTSNADAVALLRCVRCETEGRE